MSWDQFDRKIRIRKKPKALFEAWTNINSICTWFLADCKICDDPDSRVNVKKGDRLQWTWHNYPNTMELEVFECVDDECIEFSFGDSMRVCVNFIEEGDHTIVHLKQFNIPVDDESKMNFHVGCRQAWSTWLVNLKAWMEHGIVLHDRSLGKREDLFDFVNT